MKRRIRVRFLVIACVTALSLGLFATRGINLGLDLKGGVQLGLQVVTDDAVRGVTDRAIQSLEANAQAVRNGVDQFTVTNTDSAVLSERLRDWDASPATTDGVPTYRMHLKPSIELQIRNDAVVDTMHVIQNRLDKLGVGEMTIQRSGKLDAYQILVQLPGARDPEQVKRLIHTTAVLEFKLVDFGPFPSVETVTQNYGSSLPAHMELVSDAEHRYYVVERSQSISGSDLKDAFRSHDDTGRPAVGFALTPDGSRRFGHLTEEHIGKLLAVILDGHVQSVAEIENPITDSGIIKGGSGGFTSKQVDDLVLVLKSGALPASSHYIQEEVVGPSLGADSIRSGMRAACVAIVAVIAFMLFYYRWSGVNAVTAMLLNIAILMGAMAYFRAVLTLPGIAGVILTIGVGIDSNVLIFERMREELREGLSPASAVATSFGRVFITLVDTHLAALISATFLFAFGTGAIKGFAVTLLTGLVSNMFTSVFVSRTLFDWTLVRHSRGGTLSI